MTFFKLFPIILTQYIPNSDAYNTRSVKKEPLNCIRTLYEFG